MLACLIDGTMWTDPHAPPAGSPSFANARNYWQVALDPAIRDDVFHGDWCTVDYVVATASVVFDASANHLTLVQHARRPVRYRRLAHRHPLGAQMTATSAARSGGW